MIPEQPPSWIRHVGYLYFPRKSKVPVTPSSQGKSLQVRDIYLPLIEGFFHQCSVPVIIPSLHSALLVQVDFTRFKGSIFGLNVSPSKDMTSNYLAYTGEQASHYTIFYIYNFITWNWNVLFKEEGTNLKLKSYMSISFDRCEQLIHSNFIFNSHSFHSFNSVHLIFRPASK